MSETISTKEAAEILGITRQRVAALIRAGILKATRGRYMAWEVRSEDLKAFQALDRGNGKKPR